MCMSIFSSLVNADKSKKPEPPNGFSKLTVSEAEGAFSGNLCRCTGYRPIVDACKSFTSDVDLEDLGLNIFWKKGNKQPDVSKLPSYTFGGGICTFPDFLKSEIKSSLDYLNDANVTVSREGWYHPKSIKQYYDLINSGIFSECSVKVVIAYTNADILQLPWDPGDANLSNMDSRCFVIVKSRAKGKKTPLLILLRTPNIQFIMMAAELVKQCSNINNMDSMLVRCKSDKGSEKGLMVNFIEDELMVDVLKKQRLFQSFLKLSADINEASVGRKLDKFAERLFRHFASGSRAVLNPMAALFGGIVGQEVVKACSGKFRPLAMVFDMSDESSLLTLQNWVATVDVQSFEVLLCIGNKADLVPGHGAHVEYRRHMQRIGESGTDPNPEYLDFGINESEGCGLLSEEEPCIEIRDSTSHWCIEQNIEYIEACASNADFDKCLSVDGDSQGLERLFGALSAHMWPGMILKSGFAAASEAAKVSILIAVRLWRLHQVSSLFARLQVLGVQWIGWQGFNRIKIEELEEANIFVVGSGALGCEFLKNLALMGVSCSCKGKLTITDDDGIEKSNLSRQFLFRDWNIGQAKSTVAAAAAGAINPSLRIDALQNRAFPNTENVFHDTFWEGLDVIINALDNANARMYMDMRCLYFQKLLLELGTLGAKCNTQMVIPHLTENYGPSRDPPEKQAPMCTVHSFPHNIVHCLTWVHSEFEGLLEKTPNEVNSFLSNPAQYVAATRKAVDAQARDLLERMAGLSILLIELKPWPPPRRSATVFQFSEVELKAMKSFLQELL